VEPTDQFRAPRGRSISHEESRVSHAEPAEQPHRTAGTQSNSPSSELLSAVSVPDGSSRHCAERGRRSERGVGMSARRRSEGGTATDRRWNGARKADKRRTEGGSHRPISAPSMWIVRHEALRAGPVQRFELLPNPARRRLAEYRRWTNGGRKVDRPILATSLEIYWI